MIMFYIWAGMAIAVMLFTFVTVILLWKEVIIIKAWIGVTCVFFFFTIIYLFYILFTNI